LFCGGQVTKVSSSRRHTLLLTDTGQVFGVGYNSTGQCGGSTATYFHHPHQVEGLQQHRIADIAAGYHHSLVVTDQGQVSPLRVVRAVCASCLME
jgi:alpha-tubulin suppressor-like RCC1 family protein